MFLSRDVFSDAWLAVSRAAASFLLRGLCLCACLLEAVVSDERGAHHKHCHVDGALRAYVFRVRRIACIGIGVSLVELLRAASVSDVRMRYKRLGVWLRVLVSICESRCTFA